MEVAGGRQLSESDMADGIVMFRCCINRPTAIAGHFNDDSRGTEAVQMASCAGANASDGFAGQNGRQRKLFRRTSMMRVLCRSPHHA